MTTAVKPKRQSVTDSCGQQLFVGDYVAAHVRVYTGSAGARKMVKGYVRGFVGKDKVRLDLEKPDIIPWVPDKSWTSEHHVTLIAPAKMANEYHQALTYYTKEID